MTEELLPKTLNSLLGKLDSLDLAIGGLESPQRELLDKLRKTRQDVLDAVHAEGAFVCFSSPPFLLEWWGPRVLNVVRCHRRERAAGRRECHQRVVK